jgi:hypothetical protein
MGTELDKLSAETWLRVRFGADIGYVRDDFVRAANSADAAPLVQSEPTIATYTDRVEIVQYGPTATVVGDGATVDSEFVPDLQRIEAAASRQNIKLLITSALRDPAKPVSGAIRGAVAFSNHHVGHAIDMNVILEGTTYNSSALSAFSTLPLEIRSFLDEIRQAPNFLRWGNDFQNADPVHIDNGLNLRHPDAFSGKLNYLWGSRR